ncbi:MAG: helix-turn-helix transcriptional regulator [Synergistaceae bacterium]|nr:helix-turn-helix transcriptional regulator [Synergistaceae bacterium]
MKYLAEFRKKCGLTQAALAEKVNISTNSIARYERGELTPTVEIANRIANVLKTTVEELLNGSQSEEWKLEIKLSKEGVIDVSGLKPSAEINVGDKGIAITLSGSYELFADDAKFEDFVEQLRSKRQAALKFYKEAF